jgi:exodeoxyribonuclease V alpha subunit
VNLHAAIVRPPQRGRHIAEFLATRSEFAGVGLATAKRLWAVFGEDLYRILGGGELDRLAEVLPRTQAEIVIDAWRTQQAVADMVVFFDEHGLDRRVARKAVDFWGESAVAKLRENPYRLLTICPWRQIDRVAARLGLSGDDERRLVGAVEAALYERLDANHTVTAEHLLIARVAGLLGGLDIAHRALAAAIADGGAIPCIDGYQPAGAAYTERYIEIRVRKFVGASVCQKDLYASGEHAGVVEAFVKNYQSLHSQPLTEEQQDAVRLVMAARLAILTGGAGVGKTTTLRAINQVARGVGYQVWQLALAGRAAQRMADVTGQQAQTIASWLVGAKNGSIRTGAHSFVIVDESSMLDLPTMYRLLWHLSEDAKLLLVGDVAQLPPIGYGLLLHRLIRSRTVPHVELKRILRSSEATGIPSVSRAIRDGVPPDFRTYEPGKLGCSFIKCREEDVIDWIEAIRSDLPGEEVQVIGATYRGPAGIDGINTHFHAFNSHGRLRIGRFAQGDPVIWLVNDYERGLWNGSMGVVERLDRKHLLVVLDGQHIVLGIEDLKNLDLAYAISCHKAQGSQFGTVIVPVVQSVLMDRALLYTAVTRAQQRVILVGDRVILETAIQRPARSLARDVALTV